MGLGRCTTEMVNSSRNPINIQNWNYMFSALIRKFSPAPIVDPSELRRFISGESSYLTQRAVYEFSRNTLAWFGQHYFADQGFVKVYAKCRWEAFGLLGIDMTALAAGWMMATPAGAAARRDIISRMELVYSAVLREYPAPEHRPDGWNDLLAECKTRLEAIDGPLEPIKLAKPTAKRVFEVLPVYSKNKAEDHKVVRNAFDFGLIAYYDRLRKRVPAEAAARALIDGAPVDRELEMREI